MSEPVTVGTVVIGAGQAGLAAGYQLACRGHDFVIVDAADTVGAAWRQRWDSLRLFTPSAFTHLPALPLPAGIGRYPSKDDVADYLRQYAERFCLPVRLNTRVDSVTRAGGGFAVAAGGLQWRACNVVVATGAHTAAVVPGFAEQLDPAIAQIHSLDYLRPSQVPPGTVLVVGAGNSGAEIALDLASSFVGERRVLLSGRDVGHAPRLGPLTYPLLQRLGRAGALVARLALGGGGDPLGRVRPGELEAAGVERVPRVVAIRDGAPMLEDGRLLAPRAVMWCTGLRPDHGWLHVDAFDADDRLRHHNGVVRDVPGLYVVGLPWQRSITSHLLGGVGADAEHVVRRLAARSAAWAAS